jgi:copper chaperone CopZ
MKKVILKVKGMSCMECTAKVRKAIEKEGGREVKVSLEEGTPTIRINGEDIQPEMAKPPYSLSCRLYIIDGRYLPAPTEDYIKRRVREILKL